MENKVLITGASGFIGSFLVEEALRKGYEVYAGIRKTSSREYLRDERIHLLELDLSSQDALERQFSGLLRGSGGFDYVIHSAGITYAPRNADFFTVNHTYTQNLTNALQASGFPLKKFVLISSLAVFGPGDHHTFDPIKVSDVPRPISTYGKSKLMAEQHVRSLSSFPFLILNPTAVYGPRDKDFLELMKLINKGFELYIGTHRQKISLLYVKDLARAVVLSMKSSAVDRSYLLSDAKDYNKEQLGEAIRKILGKKTFKIKLPAVPLRWVIACIEKIYLPTGRQPFLNVEKVNEMSSANWQCRTDEIWRDMATSPEFTLEQGILETVAWYKENGWL